MEKMRHFQRLFLRSRQLPFLVIALTLAVVAIVITAGCLRLRSSVRRQIAARDGETLYEIARWQQQYGAEDNADATGPITDPGEQFNLILKISRLKGVLGVRLFTPQGNFTNAFPANITEAALSSSDLASLRQLKPVSHFYPAADLASLDMLAELDPDRKPAPILEVNLPLHDAGSGPLVGVAQFIIEGQSIALAYEALDRQLFWQGLGTFLSAGVLISLALALAFRKIIRQTEHLLRANQELLQTSKTSAVGAVTSHLIHGLKNPLSGLQSFVKGHLAGELADENWQDAIATTQRMQTLISSVVRILEEQQQSDSYEISLSELVEIIQSKMLPLARSAGVHFYTRLTTEGMLANREANLAILILENLIQNAFQASAEGKSVWLKVQRGEGAIQCEVQDEGPGLAAELTARLFSPCQSAKPGGSGIGLTISKQLAAQIGAKLELKSNSPRGCVFCLSLPFKLATSPYSFSPAISPD